MCTIGQYSKNEDRRLSCHDQCEYACYVRQSCVLVATSKDIIAFPFAFAAHVLTPAVLNADIYRPKIVT